MKKQIIETKHYIVEIAEKGRASNLITFKFIGVDEKFRTKRHGNQRLEIKTPFERYILKETGALEIIMLNWAERGRPFQNAINGYKHKWNRDTVEKLNAWFTRINKEWDSDFNLQIEYKFR